MYGKSSIEKAKAFSVCCLESRFKVRDRIDLGIVLFVLVKDKSILLYKAGRSIYKILTLIYIEYKLVDEIAKLFNTDKSKIGKALTAGYKYLSEVLFLRF